MSTNQAIIAGASVSHEDATLDQLEAATLECDEAAVEQLLEAPGVDEAFVLQTCNRVEAYVVSDRRDLGQRAVNAPFFGIDSRVITELGHEASIRHLFRVAAGLESLVVGEDQILGQVRTAYQTAREAGGIGPILEEAITKTIRVGERARTETAINDGVVSLASAAVKLTEETHGLTGATAVVIGAGEMGTLAANRLAGRVDELVLANRTVERAQRLADNIEPVDTTVRVTGLDDLAGTLSAHDVVISATGSDEWILTPTECRELSETLVVDITRPRDIPPAADDMAHLTVYDLDRLEAVTEKTRQMRKDAAREVSELIEEEFERLMSQYKRKQADTVISAMYESAERLKTTELETTFEKGEFDTEQKELIEAMTDSLVNQLLAPPTSSLRDAAEDDDWSTIHTALKLFDPDLDGEMPSLVAEKTPDNAPVPDNLNPEEMPDDVNPEEMPDEIEKRLTDREFGNSDD